MTREVIDGPLAPNAWEGAQAPLTRLRIQADADPDVLLRVAAILNALNSAPLEVHFRRQQDNRVLVDVALENCPTLAIEMVCRKLEQLTCVVAVEIPQTLTSRPERPRLAALLTQVADQERIRLGADLHDGLCQELTGLALMLRHLAKRAQAKRIWPACELDELSNLADSTIISAHDIAHGLLPVELRHGDFRTVIEALAQTTLRAHNVKLRIQFGGLRSHYPEGRVAEHLYRIAQESVSNAIRHGAATRITLSMRATSRSTAFSISDNGRGRSAAAAKGVGIQIMRYRMRVLGGWLELCPRPRGGAQVKCVVPAGGRQHEC